MKEKLIEHYRKDGFRGGLGNIYRASARQCFLRIPILEFLWGSKLDEFVFGYLSSSNPSSVRIIKDGELECCNSSLWRVTIYLNKDETIKSIRQEIVYDIWEKEISNGSDVLQETQKRGLIK